MTSSSSLNSRATPRPKLAQPSVAASTLIYCRGTPSSCFKPSLCYPDRTHRFDFIVLLITSAGSVTPLGTAAACGVIPSANICRAFRTSRIVARVTSLTEIVRLRKVFKQTFTLCRRHRTASKTRQHVPIVRCYSRLVFKRRRACSSVPSSTTDFVVICSLKVPCSDSVHQPR